MKKIYEEPRFVTNIEECHFYHTMDIPGYGHVEGEWDLRKGAHSYLGGVNFKGKRVLEIGTASGFLCFYMESQGAEVVAYDLSENQPWDIVPFSRSDYKNFILKRKTDCKKINNAYWLCHQAYNSHSKMVYGTVYKIPEEIGTFDVSTFGCVLPHIRDPFLALQNVLKITKETVIVTGPVHIINPFRGGFAFRSILSNFLGQMEFLPESELCEPKDAWWNLSPGIIKKFLRVLGFEESKVRYHFQKYLQRRHLLYTIVGHRTKRA